MGFQIATPSQLITVTSASATSSATGFPLSRTYAKYAPFVQGWRSTSTATQTLTYNFASTNIVAALLYDVNFTTATVGGSSRTITADVIDSVSASRYKLWVPLSITGSTSQIVTIANQSTTDGKAYFSVGKIFFVSAVTELAQNPKRDFEVTMISPQLRNEYVGGYESTPAGPDYHNEVWDWTNIPTANTTNVFAAIRIGMHQPFVAYHNLGDTAGVYFLQRIEDVSLRRGTLEYGIRYTLRQIP